MVLVPANMPRFDFSPCKKKVLFLVPAKFFVSENSPSTRDYFKKTKKFARTCLKNKIFCRDQKLQNGSNHHVSRMQIITKMGPGTILKNKKICRDQKQFFFHRD